MEQIERAFSINAADEHPLVPPLDPPNDEDISSDDENIWALEDVVDEDSDPRDLRVLGSRFHNIGVIKVFFALRNKYHMAYGAVIILYLLYPNLRQTIVKKLRKWILRRGCGFWQLERLFLSLGELHVAEQIEQEHAEALLEFVDVLGQLMVEGRRKLLAEKYEGNGQDEPGLGRPALDAFLWVPLWGPNSCSTLSRWSLFVGSL